MNCIRIRKYTKILHSKENKTKQQKKTLITQLKILFQPFLAIAKYVHINFCEALHTKNKTTNIIFNRKYTLVRLNDSSRFHILSCNINIFEHTFKNVTFVTLMDRISFVGFCTRIISIVYTIFNVKLSIVSLRNVYEFQEIWKNLRELKRVHTDRQSNRMHKHF